MSRAPEPTPSEVRAAYAAAAHAAEAGQVACCGPSADGFGAARYDDLAELPEAAVSASLGCGNPLAVAELRQGETVLDLGSGGGIDVLLSARRVGPDGLVYGLDMTPEMLRLARRNAEEAGATNVSFIEGTLEAIPLPSSAVDVIISNCVVNLSPDKPAAFAEMFRVLRPGGRLGISDVVTEDRLSAEERRARAGEVSCVAGALPRAEYLNELRAAGFEQATITFTHAVGDGVHGALVQAIKPG